MQFKKCFINGKIYGAEKESNECTDAVYSINGDMSAYELLIGAIKNSNEQHEISSDPYIVKKEKIPSYALRSSLDIIALRKSCKYEIILD